MSRISRGVFAAAAALAAAGCAVSSEDGSLGQQLGFATTSPDEFLIIASKPLERPPSFDLPTPTPGAPSRVRLDPYADARSALFLSREEFDVASVSAGELLLLDGADATDDNSAIRQTLAEEDPEAGRREFGLRTFFGQPVPATVDDPDSVLVSAEEIDILRQQGYRTPAAPPIEPESNNIGFDEY